MAKNEQVLAQLMSNMLSFGRVVRSRMMSLPGKPKTNANFATVAQFETLFQIGQEGTTSMKNLAEQMLITPASATSIVERLLDQKLIERVHDKKDRRQVNIKISAKGKKMIKSHFCQAHKKMSEIFSKLEINSQKQLIRILEELQNAHKIEAKTKKCSQK